MKITDFLAKKARKEKISVLTCYDYPSARLLAKTDLDCVLVGDSVAQVVHGYESTVMATIEMMVMHTKAVAHGLGKQLLISDLPFLCHRSSREELVRNVRQLIQAGAHAIKIEGGDIDTCETIANLSSAGIPIVGHIGLTPQSILALGGHKIQGREEAQAVDLLVQAKRLENAGCRALVIECVPLKVAHTITEALCIPTIGIGAGVVTDGQILVWHDVLGFQNDFQPRFLRKFTQAEDIFLSALHAYVREVKSMRFPSEEHAYQ